MENMAPTEATGTWEPRFAEISSRHCALTTRMDRIETHVNAIAQDQNNAADPNQALCRNVLQMQGRLRDMESDESYQEIERELQSHQHRRE